MAVTRLSCNDPTMCKLLFCSATPVGQVYTILTYCLLYVNLLSVYYTGSSEWVKEGGISGTASEKHIAFASVLDPWSEHFPVMPK